MSKLLGLLAVAAAAVVVLLVWPRSGQVPDTDTSSTLARPPSPSELETPLEPGDPSVLGEERAVASIAPDVQGALGPERVRIGGTAIRIGGEHGEAGSPAAEVIVAVRVGAESHAVTTDDSGRFDLVVDDPGSRPLPVRVSITPDTKLQGVSVDLTLGEEEYERLGLRLECFRRDFLRGRTLEPSGASVPGVEISLTGGGDGPLTFKSGHDGTFVVTGERVRGLASAVKSGFELVYASPPKAVGSEEWLIVLAATGSLEVEVVDRFEKPVEGVWVSIAIHPAERYGTGRNAPSGTKRPVLEAQTNAAGLAAIARAWSGQKLLVRYRMKDGGGAFERHREGELVTETGSTLPIVVARQGHQRLRLRLPHRLRIEGIVREPTGEGVRNVNVLLRSTDVGPSSEDGITGHIKSDADGRFAFDLPSRRRIDEVMISARQSNRVALGWSGSSFSAGFPAAVRILRRDELATEEVVEVELVLEPTRTISGRAENAEGEPIAASVHAFLVDSPIAIQREHGGNGLRGSGEDGGFTVYGLFPGVYDLRVRPHGLRNTESPLAERWVRNVAAGTHDLVVRLEDEKPVKVTVEVEYPYGELETTIVLRGTLDPWGGEHGGVPALPRVFVNRAPTGWPDAADRLWSGGSSATVEQGHVGFGLSPGAPTRTFQLDAGAYWFGAKGRDTDGRYCFPVGTGLVSVTAGEYLVRLELAPAVALEGRVVGASDVASLAIMVVHDSGEPLHLDYGHDGFHAIQEIGADGSFRFKQIPIGEFELRVGTRDQLERGGARHHETLHVKGHDTQRVEIDLGG